MQQLGKMSHTDTDRYTSLIPRPYSAFRHLCAQGEPGNEATDTLPILMRKSPLSTCTLYTVGTCGCLLHNPGAAEDIPYWEWVDRIFKPKT